MTSNQEQSIAKNSADCPRGVISVDGELLVVRSPAVLPMRCIITNLPIDEPSRMSTKSVWGASLPQWILLIALYCAAALPLTPVFDSIVAKAIPTYSKDFVVIAQWCLAISLMITFSSLAGRLERKLGKCEITYGVHPEAYFIPGNSLKVSTAYNLLAAPGSNLIFGFPPRVRWFPCICWVKKKGQEH